MQQPRSRTLFTDTGVTMSLAPAHYPARELRWGVAGARSVAPQPIQPREAKFHQLVGPREAWKRNLPTWGALYYPAVAPGVDLWLEAQDQGLTYSLRAEHGSNLREVRLEWRGAQSLQVTDEGKALEVDLADGQLREEGLRCGQEDAQGQSSELSCRYREAHAKGPDLWEYVIEVDVKDPSAPAWVDPTVRWNTFVGGNGNDSLAGITILDDGSGQVFTVGSSGSSNAGAVEPRLTGDLFGNGGLSDVVVTRYNADGTVRWTSVLGGNSDDFGTAVVIGTGGFIYVAGTTSSFDFPTGTSTTAPPSNSDGFVLRLASDGSTLDWVRFIGGASNEQIHSLILGKDGKLYAAGSTNSPSLPASDAGSGNGTKDFFVSRIDGTTGAVERTLILRGTGEDEALAITQDPQASSGALLYVTGYTESPNFPMTASGLNAHVETDGGRDAVVLKLTQDLLSTPIWGAYLGGHGQDEGRAILQQSTPSRLLVVGTTRSSDFPNSTSQFPTGANAFVANFDQATGQRSLSLVLGGAQDDEGLAVAPGSFNSVYVGGKTSSMDLPASLGFDTTAAGQTEGYVLRLAANGSTLTPEWGTYVGGLFDDEVRALASSPNNELLIGGVTNSSDIFANLSPNGDKTTFGFQQDMFLISLPAFDLTPPTGMVKDGPAADLEEQQSTTTLNANWSFQDNETPVTDYQIGIGTAPGCDDFIPFHSVGQNTFLMLDSDLKQMPPLTPGKWYFTTVRATNGVQLSTALSSNGFLALTTDGQPSVHPPRPSVGTPCPGQPPDGGSDGGVPDGGVSDGGTDGGTPDGGPPPGPGGDKSSPVGWGCGTTGGSVGLGLLVLVALGLGSAGRKRREVS